MIDQLTVRDHYGRDDLSARINQALQQAGLGARPVDWSDLSPLDQFHVPPSQRNLLSYFKSDPVSWDTELARMAVTKEAGYGDETEEAGDAAGAVKSTERD